MQPNEYHANWFNSSVSLLLGKRGERREENQGLCVPGGRHLPRGLLQLRKVPFDVSKQVLVQYDFWVDEAVPQSTGEITWRKKHHGCMPQNCGVK